MAPNDDFGGFAPPPPATPMGAGFVFGYEACQRLFFGAPGVLTLPPGFDPHTLTNPFADGSDEGRGWAEAYYDFTQK